MPCRKANPCQRVGSRKRLFALVDSMAVGDKKEGQWYPRYYRDYQESTGHLSLLEHGAYSLLLDQYYLLGKPLPADTERLMRLVRCQTDAERIAVASVLKEFFTLESGQWVNARAEIELLTRQELIETRRNAGKTAAKARWDAIGTANAMRDASQTECGNDAQSQSHTHLQITDTVTKQDTSQGTVSAKAAPNPQNVETWKAYKQAYLQRYGVEPVRNASVNGQISQFVKRLGIEAPAVASFYVGSNAAFYVRGKHGTGPMLKDAEGLRTEWATGREVTQTQALQTDKTATRGAVFRKLIEEAKNGTFTVT
jgi:uncharacterized protein YdaU (DUF1376 family)